MGTQEAMESFARDVVLMQQVGVNPVVVHGGGPMINQLLKRLGVVSEFRDGKRVTDAETVEVVEMVLSGTVNQGIVQAINGQGGRAIGLSGKDANLMICDFDQPELGFVGRPVECNVDFLRDLHRAEIIPVIAPIGGGRNGETFNVNGDTAAGAIAAALKADRLLLLTDVAGVKNAEGEVVTELTPDAVREMTAIGRHRRRHDPQDRDRACRDGGRSARRGHPRRPRAQRLPARALHRSRRRQPDPGPR